MRIVLITQDEPFFLAESLDYFFRNVNSSHQIVGCVLLSPSPFGRRVSFIEKSWKTFRVFGFKFFFYYTILFIRNIFIPTKRVGFVLNKNHVPTIKLENSINSSDSLENIKNLNPDMLISILGNEIFKKELLNLATYGCLNLHTSLLPKYRGLMPTFWVLRNNEEKTGVSVFIMDEGIDSGPIVVQKEIQILPNSTQNELIKKTKLIGMDAIIEAINKISGGEHKLIPNNRDEMTYYKMPTRSDVKEFYRLGKRFF